MSRPPREDYVRTSIEGRTWCIEPAVEYRDGDSCERLLTMLGFITDSVVDGFGDCDQMFVARLVAGRLAEHWPDRAYFVECWPADGRGFAQVFQPFGLTRNR